jgi:hypothetical protein
MKNIVFINRIPIPKEYYPTPASKHIPEWYKNTLSYKDGEKKRIGQDLKTPSTIKKCIPIFDAITSGYIIYSHSDVHVSQRLLDNGELHPYYQWSSGPTIEMHPYWQGELHPAKMTNSTTLNIDYPKWVNPWGIKTPAGYSCFITQPLHRESVFTILPGIVDTDTYTANINFPFVLNNPEFEGTILAGTPIAQIIPFKRETWKMSYGNEKTLEENINATQLIASKFFDAYKRTYWNRKEYK